MKAHKPSTVRQALALLEQNKSIREVANQLNLPKSTVHDMSKKTPLNCVKSKGGRPRRFYIEMHFL